MSTPDRPHSARSVFVLLMLCGCAPAGPQSTKCPDGQVQRCPECECRGAARGTPKSQTPGWATASDSASNADQMRKANSCFATAGCPYAPHPLPSCAADVVPESDWWDLARNKKQVVAAGRLEVIFGETTQAGCTVVRPCCNTERARLVVRTPRGRISLTSPTKPHAFVCLGDQSADCCPFAPEVNVVVRGVISAPFGLHNYEMTEPELCVPPEPPARK
jgi:hypothetical protein